MSYMQIWLVYYQMYPVLTIFSWSHLLQEFDSQHKQDSDQSSAKTVSRILDKKTRWQPNSWSENMKNKTRQL